MGAISDWTENLANEITSLREGRGEFLDQLRTETNNLLDNFNGERRQMAEELRNTLSTFLSDLSSDEGERRAAARRDEEQRKVTVSEIFSNSRGMVERFSMERQEMERELRSELGALRDDLGKARRIWEDLTKKKVSPVIPEIQEEAPPVAVLPAVEEVEEKEAPSVVGAEEEILRIVAENPEGIRLVDIGNRMGVNWRSLTFVISEMSNEGKVEKIGDAYYPVQKGE